MKHRLSNGQKWKVERKRLLGLCDPEARVLTIPPGMTRLELIDAAIHEVMHAELPRMSEERVDKVATSCAELVLRLLKKDGWLKG